MNAVTTMPAGLVRPHATPPLPSDDALAVQQLVARVYLAEDSRDLEALRQIFTPDMVHEHTLFGRQDGIGAFIAMIEANPQGFDGFRHQAVNIVTSGAGDGEADALSYILVLKLFAQAGEASADLPRIVGHGVVRDHLRKHDGRWSISHRLYDQFAVSATLLPDAEARDRAAQRI